MILEIPEEEREILSEWIGADDDRLDRVLAAVEEAKPTLRRQELTEQLAKATTIAHEAIAELLDTLINMLHTVSAFPDEDRDLAAADLTHAIRGEGVHANTERFTKRLARVLQSKVLEVTGKALGILSDNQNLFCSVRTLSEIRPVFVDRGLDPQAAVIVHQMKLVYHAGPGGQRSEIFVAFDRGDLDTLDTLKEVVDRAIAKHEKLVAMVTKMDLPLL
jgi:hypothetical protein